MLLDKLRENAVSFVSFVIAAILAGVILFVLPQEREVRNLGIFLFKLLPFIFASLAIASVKRDMLQNKYLQFLLIVGSYIFFFAYLIPKIIFHSDVFVDLYNVLLITAPYIILCFVLIYRLGGANGNQTFRLAMALLLIMVSGIEDLAYFTVNYDPTWNLPERWDWVTHIAVRIGHAPTRNEIIVFAIVHFILAFCVLVLPFEKLQRYFKPVRWQLLAQD